MASIKKIYYCEGVWITSINSDDLMEVKYDNWIRGYIPSIIVSLSNSH